MEKLFAYTRCRIIYVLFSLIIIVLNIFANANANANAT